MDDDAKDVELALASFEEQNLANEVVVARDGAEALDYLYRRGQFADRPAGPACLVLDVRMPEMSGVALQERLTKLEIALPTIVISAHADTRLVVRVMRSGALNFLEKPFRMQELCENIQEAIRLDREKRRRREEQEDAENRFAQLNPGELQVMELVVAGKTNKMTAETLGVSVRTVENRRARIKKKLLVNSRSELLELVASCNPPSRTS